MRNLLGSVLNFGMIVLSVGKVFGLLGQNGEIVVVVELVVVEVVVVEVFEVVFIDFCIFSVLSVDFSIFFTVCFPCFTRLYFLLSVTWRQGR